MSLLLPPQNDGRLTAYTETLASALLYQVGDSSVKAVGVFELDAQEIAMAAGEAIELIFDGSTSSLLIN